MAELFTHVLAGYVIGTLLSWRYDWVTYPFVTVVMVGAALPDLNRIGLVLPADAVAALLGVPFSWTPLHRAGGTLLVVCLGALLVSRQYRRAAVALLFVGAASHYALDFFLYKPSGVTGPLLWPFRTHGFAVEGFYLSSDRWPAVVVTAVAGVVWAVDRRWMRDRETTPPA
ncbi:hypothetical protein JCM17823_11100 [Halorubrum gandharaense]